MKNKNNAPVILLVIAVAIVCVTLFLAVNPSIAQTAKQGDSWIDDPGFGEGAEVIFTDCRNYRGEGHRPIPLFKSVGASPSRAKQPAGAYLTEKRASSQMSADSAVAAEVSHSVTEQREVTKKDESPKQAANSIYLSNDDSMSLSSAQRIEYAIKHYLPIPSSHLRPHEFLNYYKFDSEPVKSGEDFSVKAALAFGIKRKQSTLALSVRGRTVSLEQRKNAAITFIIDQSGSMNSANKMTFVKRGMKQVFEQFKKGDVINVVQFNHAVCTPLQGFVVGRDKKELFDKAIDYLQSTGSTNLHDGLVQGYQLATKYYLKNDNNRVIMITDAMANTGVVNEQLSGTITKHYDTQKIAFSGIGVGHDFNDKMLNQLTEAGKGAYLFLASESAVNRVFGDKFISLLEVVARNVHFKLTLPDSLKMDVFYGEESSTVKSEVQAIHYFANSSQLFLSDLKGEPKKGDKIELDIEYTQADTGKMLIHRQIWDAYKLFTEKSPIVDKARLILSLTDLIGETSRDTYHYWSCSVYPCYRHGMGILPPGPRPRGPFGADLKRSQKLCSYYSAQMEELSTDISGDPEVKYVLGLKKQYCGRFLPIEAKPVPGGRK